MSQGDGTQMRSPFLDVDYWKGYCSDAFGIDMSAYPRADQTSMDQGGYDTSGTNIFFANGGEDPW